MTVIFRHYCKGEIMIKNPPSDDAYPIAATLFIKKHFSKHEINVNSLSLEILELIKDGQIKCEIGTEESHIIGKKLNEKDMEVMKSITLRIANKGELKTSQTHALNILKTMNKSKKFNLKDMLKKGKNTATANRFKSDFLEFRKAVENENEFTPKDYRDILENGKFTKKGNELKNEWESYQNYLKSKNLTEKCPPESAEENSSQIIYGACFNIEREVLELRKNDSPLADFIDKDGYKMLNIIFNNTLSNSTEKSKGDGIFYGVNDKYTIPGGG